MERDSADTRPTTPARLPKPVDEMTVDELFTFFPVPKRFDLEVIGQSAIGLIVKVDGATAEAMRRIANS